LRAVGGKRFDPPAAHFTFDQGFKVVWSVWLCHFALHPGLISRPNTKVVNDSLDGSERQAPRALERLVDGASPVGANGVHLQMLGDSAQISFRLDGVMTLIDTLNKPLDERIVGRIK